jgi:hypothetical protein
MPNRLPILFASTLAAALAACAGNDGSSAGPGDGGGGLGPDGTAGGKGDSGTGPHGDAATGDDGGPGPGTDSGGPKPDGGPPPTLGASVLMHHNHVNRDGSFVDAKLTKAAAATMHNDTAFSPPAITGKAYASPLFVEAGKVPGLNGGKGAIFIATESNDVYALDEATGAQVWTANLGTPGGPSCGNAGKISPQGVTGTPAIDLASGLIVMDSAQGPGSTQDHVMVGLDVATGKTKWSVSLKGVKDAKGNVFDPAPQLQRPAILIVNGYAYAGFGGNIGDCGTYHGWIIGVPLDGNKANVKAWRPQTSKAAIWGPGGPSSDGSAVYVTTGNGAGGASWAGSEGVIRLGFDLSFTSDPKDYFAPSDFANMDSTDQDISGSGPLVLDAPALGKTVILALGKNGDAYLIDAANMGGVGATILDHQNVSAGAISNAAAWATVGGSVYVVANNNWTAGNGCAMGGGDLFAIKIDSSLKMTEVWCADSGGHTSPIITTSDGTNDAIVWIGGGSDGAGGGGAGDDKLHAFDLLTGTEIPNSASVPGMAVLSSTLIAAKGRIYAASNKGTVHAVAP